MYQLRSATFHQPEARSRMYQPRNSVNPHLFTQPSAFVAISALKRA